MRFVFLPAAAGDSANIYRGGTPQRCLREKYCYEFYVRVCLLRPIIFFLRSSRLRSLWARRRRCSGYSPG